jgi:glucose-1-phosphate adenylyltransferase
VKIRPGAVVRESILLTDCVVGSGAVIERAVIDKRVHIEANVHIGGGIADPNIRIAAVGKNSIVPAGMVIEPDGSVSTDVIASDYHGLVVKAGETIETKRQPYEI